MHTFFTKILNKHMSFQCTIAAAFQSYTHHFQFRNLLAVFYERTLYYDTGDVDKHAQNKGIISIPSKKEILL
jgi:hypothetical protein